VFFPQSKESFVTAIGKTGKIMLPALIFAFSKQAGILSFETE